MANIDINPECGDQVTVNVTCACKPPLPPVPAPAPAMRETALHGYAVATVLPHYCSYSAIQIGPRLVGASAILPAGERLASVGVAVAKPALGSASGPSTVGVYIGDIPELVAASAPKSTLFTREGLRWAQLDTPVEEADEDRRVWLVVQVPAFSEQPPVFLAALQGYGDSLINAGGYRSVVVEGAEGLPPLFDGDAVSFTTPEYVPMLTGLPIGVAQP